MKAIVTGGAGFIGSHLVELLLSKGYEVFALDNMANGQQENIDLFANNPRYHFFKFDVSNPPEIRVFDNADYVFHLAGLADIVPSIEEPAKYYNANVTGTIMMLEEARKAKVKKFVYAASSSCYGIAQELPTPEEADVNPTYPYAMTKFLGEYIGLMWNQIYKQPFISLRLFNVYGPRARSNNTYGAVFKTFLSQKLHDKPLTVVGDGTQKRDFVYVTDVAKAFLMAAESDFQCEIFNIGSGNPQSINHLVEMIGGKDYPVEYLPWRPGEPLVTHADISSAQEHLGWKPDTSFEEGVDVLIKKIEYYRDVKVWDKESIQEATKKWHEILDEGEAK